jgi:hypothetical protein
MFFTLREPATGQSCCVSRSSHQRIARLLLPSVFIILIHYIWFSDLALWRIKGVMCLISNIPAARFFRLVSSGSFLLDPLLLDS